MKFLSPISTSLCASICQSSWELAALGVKYLLMGDGDRDHRQITEDDLRLISMSVVSYGLRNILSR
ncbi:hypothetical protein [Nodularia sp. NIES-3585]|uniref:hypothetical protein n=1 Tax=Nodularia sp. NIES-3585 TaxID=1973477 RepID=UPI0011314120|nr:hypothetical protein [Nodularia sp. NIES-3585]